MPRDPAWRTCAEAGAGTGNSRRGRVALDMMRKLHYQCKRCGALVQAAVGRGCGGRECVANGNWKPQRFWRGQIRKIESMLADGHAAMVAGAIDAGRDARCYALSERDAWAAVHDALLMIP